MDTAFTPTRSATFGDRLRLEWYLLRLETALQDYPGRRRRQILRELRAELAATAQETGMATALADLGRPGRLAAQYLSELDVPTPRWNDGAVVAALVAFGLPLYFWFGVGIGATEALGVAGSGAAEVSIFGVTLDLVNTPEELSVAWQVHWGWVLGCALVGVVVFLVAARAWRALAR
ncbi:HAAS signaling domain-containing protein [Antribacter gilvus]|uniref:HAAS signaling domain-containing protein n=1 Tax=Antribacter gilvus TaxID=2304675 RepID=UPI0013DF3779|nr:hypothetical protein [Antribacter gilvus]